MGVTYLGGINHRTSSTTSCLIPRRHRPTYHIHHGHHPRCLTCIFHIPQRHASCPSFDTVNIDVDRSRRASMPIAPHHTTSQMEGEKEKKGGGGEGEDGRGRGEGWNGKQAWGNGNGTSQLASHIDDHRRKKPSMPVFTVRVLIHT
jgi:hypothetical protein